MQISPHFGGELDHSPRQSVSLGLEIGGDTMVETRGKKLKIFFSKTTRGDRSKRCRCMLITCRTDLL